MAHPVTVSICGQCAVFEDETIKMTLINPDIYANAPDNDNANSSVKIKQPKRVLHFSDGVLEEYSTDDEEVDSKPTEAPVDPSTLTWGPWFWYKAWAAGNTTLGVLDSIGEFFARVFGITTPRYYFELEEYKRRQNEAKEKEEQEAGWSKPSKIACDEVALQSMETTQPKPVDV